MLYTSDLKEVALRIEPVDFYINNTHKSSLLLVPSFNSLVESSLWELRPIYKEFVPAEIYFFKTYFDEKFTRAPYEKRSFEQPFSKNMNRMDFNSPDNEKGENKRQ